MGEQHPGIERVTAPVYGAPGEKALDLFYDLVYVAGIVVLSQAYSNNPGFWSGFWVVLVFSLMWALWLRTNLLLHDRGAVNATSRALLVLQMVVVLVLAVAGGDKTLDIGSLDRHHIVGPLFAVALATLAALYATTTTRPGVPEPPRARRVLTYGVVAALFALTPVLPQQVDVVIAVVGLMILMLPSHYVDGRAVASRFDAQHVVERFGEFTIIVLGETFVKVGLAALKGGISRLDFVILPVAIVIVFCTWWLYFADVAPYAAARVTDNARPWVLAHFPLHLSAVAFAIGCAELMLEGGGSHSHVLTTITAPLVMVVLSLALLAWISRAPQRRRMVTINLVGVAVLLGVAGLASTSSVMGDDRTSLAMAAVMVGIVLFSRPGRLAPTDDDQAE